MLRALNKLKTNLLLREEGERNAKKFVDGSRVEEKVRSFLGVYLPRYNYDAKGRKGEREVLRFVIVRLLNKIFSRESRRWESYGRVAIRHTLIEEQHPARSQ